MLRDLRRGRRSGRGCISVCALGGLLLLLLQDSDPFRFLVHIRDLLGQLSVEGKHFLTDGRVNSPGVILQI